MKKLSTATRQLRYLATAWVLAVAALVPTLTQGTANAAATQVTARSIQMSSSVISATSTNYLVTFTQASMLTKGIVIDFCTSPLVGTTCTLPSGLSITGSPAVTLQTCLTATWSAASANSNRTLLLTKAAGDTCTTISFTITTVTNPSGLGTFYARILSYANDTGADSPATYSDTAPGTTYNYGGVALSTANQLIVTAKVQESLTFCVYTTGSDCSGASGTAVTLGDGNGVLANTATTYTSTGKFGLATNAQSGVIVRFKGATLTSGSNTITAHGTGSGSCTADSVTTTVEQYGLRISAAGSGVTSDAGYACSAGNHSLDTTNIATTYGDTLATTAGAIDESQTTMEFAAKSATASEAGIYTSTLTFVATGTY